MRERLPDMRRALTHKFSILSRGSEVLKFPMRPEERRALVTLLRHLSCPPAYRAELDRWIVFFESVPEHSGVEEHKGYLTVGFYEDGRVGELFVKMDRQGSRVSGFVDAWAIAMSLLLQMGFPLVELCRRFIGMRFEPSGAIKGRPLNEQARSPVDYVCRYLVQQEGNGDGEGTTDAGAGQDAADHR